VEYFSKWVEAKPLLSITSAAIQKFFWQNIVCRFRVPYKVTVDNGKQFDSTNFSEFCITWAPSSFPSVYHPQSNGAVERANNVIFCRYQKEHHSAAKKQMGQRATEVDLVSQHHNF
jgi:transposase InsO family protein